MWGLSKDQQEELEKLRKKHRSVRPEDVVKFAKNPKTALHERFEWDDSAAAGEYRLIQARQVLNVAVTIVEGCEEPVKMFVSLTPDRGGGGYRGIVDVLSRETYRLQMLDDAVNELRAFKQKYRTLNELSKIFAETRQLKLKLGRKKARKKRAS